ncbi:MAG: hypothetical protein WC494_02880 [Candidatus Pacearchaeota archaeon]
MNFLIAKSREDIEGDIIVESVKSDFKNVKSYLKSIGWEGSFKDYVDICYLNQKIPATKYLFLTILSTLGLIGLLIFGTNVTGYSITDESQINNSIVGALLFMTGIIGIIILLIRKKS